MQRGRKFVVHFCKLASVFGNLSKFFGNFRKILDIFGIFWRVDRNWPVCNPSCSQWDYGLIQCFLNQKPDTPPAPPVWMCYWLIKVLQAHRSVFVDVLAVASFHTCSATAIINSSISMNSRSILPRANALILVISITMLNYSESCHYRNNWKRVRAKRETKPDDHSK